jgi:hypothetical protein
MQLIAKSITAIAAAERTAERGRYRVILDVDGSEHELIYTVELTPQLRSISWQPSDSVLSDPRIEVLIVAALTDLVVAFHHGDRVDLPQQILPLRVGSETAVVRL